MKWKFAFLCFFLSTSAHIYTSLFMIVSKLKAKGTLFPLLSSQACAHKALKKCPITKSVILISYTPFLSTLPFLSASDSDDSDHEGESHVSRVLREYSDKKKIEELDRMPITSPLSSSSSTGSNYRNRILRDAIRQEHGINNSSSPAPTSLASSASSSDYLVRSRRARGETGHQPSRSEDSSSAPTTPLRPIRTREIGQKPAGILSPPESPASATLPTPTSPNTPSSASLETPRIGNRFRTSSDASLSAALGRLEGKRNQDALVAQVSHLGSTRARSPHRGNRAYREHIDVAPPPPLPTPKSDYRQQRQQPLTPPSSSGSPSNTLRSSPSMPSLSSSSSTSRRNGQPVDLGAYGQRQQQQQQTQQQQARYF